MEFEDVRAHFENNHRGVITTFQANGAGHSSIVVCGAYRGRVQVSDSARQEVPLSAPKLTVGNVLPLATSPLTVTCTLRAGTRQLYTPCVLD